LQYFSFVGKLVGKALYEGLLLEVRFAPFFVKRWTGFSSSLDDLPSLDKDLYRNLLYLKRYSKKNGDDDLSDLSLYFTTLRDSLNGPVTHELVPEGRQILVTNENRFSYIHLMAHEKLNAQIYNQTKAFLAGLCSVISASFLRLFGPNELQTLLSGTEREIQIEDWKQHTVYAGDYSPSHPTIEAYWKTLASFSPFQKAAILKFATGCSRPPLFGFRDLHPTFCIAMDGENQDRLPSSSTCMNLLKLPAYYCPDTIRSKLLFLVEQDNNIGFHSM
jgi:ubiquitin-protein ligase E3 C